MERIIKDAIEKKGSNPRRLDFLLVLPGGKFLLETGGGRKSPYRFFAAAAPRPYPQTCGSCVAEKSEPYGEQKTAGPAHGDPKAAAQIYDSVFRTVMEYLPQLIIPVINEVYHTAYPADEPVTVLKNEHVTWHGKRITDLFFAIRHKTYHVECQSRPDGRMLIRVMEYVSAIALDSAVEIGCGRYEMRFPETFVIYIRSAKSTPEKLTMCIHFPDGQSVEYDVPLLQVREYTREDLFQKKLLMLLPYYLVRYEKECREIGELSSAQQEEADRRMDVFLEECEWIIRQIEETCQGETQEYLYQTLVELILGVAEYLTPANEKRRVQEMGGHVIRTQAQMALERGIAQGIQQGELKKARATAQNMETMGFSMEKIAQALATSVETVRQWLGESEGAGV